MIDKAVQVNADSHGMLQSFPKCAEAMVEKVLVPMNMYLCHVVLYRGTLNYTDKCLNTKRAGELNSKVVVGEGKDSSSQSNKVDHELRADIAIPSKNEPIRLIRSNQASWNCLYSCAHCEKIFRDSADLIIHIKLVHDNVLQFACTKCGQIFVTSENYARHDETCVKKQPTCKLCSKVFLKRSLLNAHLRSAHPDRPRCPPCTCPLCKKTFNRKHVMQEHFALEHPGVRPYKCTVCVKDFPSSALLSVHMIVHRATRRHRCARCNKEFRHASTLNDHVKYVHSTVRKHLCQYCCKGFVRATDLLRHETVCNYEKYVACTLCDLKFVNETNLKTHMRKHASDQQMCNLTRDPNSTTTVQIPLIDVQSFPCAECNNVFSSTIKRSRHVTRYHGQERSFMCSYCTKRFPNKSTLDRHVRGHTGEKPFACPVCPKRFTQATSRNDHVLLHNGVRPHVCKECGKAFTQSSSLRSHKRVHKPALF